MWSGRDGWWTSTGLAWIQIERLPDGRLRIGALVRNSDLAHHAVVQEEYAVLSQALLAGSFGAVAEYGDDGREFVAADAVHVLSEHGDGLQQASAGVGMFGD